ncbi:multidrug DMT transporter permease [Providencia rettgeri]|nr:multidrug DMT transporter permease [Proteus mirabilis]MBG2768331.1 multidrug DMT transporter permease [Proteus mirabilis]
MNDLRILIARLGWPSTSARWWTMQELAARLGKPETKAETESSLLHLLRLRKLEAEVVEVLCIFWIAVKELNYSPPNFLAENIISPSPLSVLLMNAIGSSIYLSNNDLTLVSEDFIIPDDFDIVQGADLPRIFHTTISRLEAFSHRPFVRQMAFEWTKNRMAYPEAPYQGDAGYFIRPLGDGFAPHFSTRTALRAISAYLRTLAVARHFWEIPAELINQQSLLALPIHPTLAFLRPKRPEWLPTFTELNGDSKEIEASLLTLLAQVEVENSGDELIAFSSPISMSMEQCIEVSIVRWLQIGNGDMGETELGSHLESFWREGLMLSSQAQEPLSSTTLVVPHWVNKDCKAWPLAGTLDLGRIGYLQHDLYPSRLFLPTMVGSENVIEITPYKDELQAKIKEQVIAKFHYWNAGWGPAQPRQLKGNCGTALISRGTAYREGAEVNKTQRTFYSWQVRILHRNGSYEQFDEKITRGVIFV